MKFSQKMSFEAKELDLFLSRWLGGTLGENELNEWKQVLTYDTRFREEFCDFIKALRDTGWRHEAYDDK